MIQSLKREDPHRKNLRHPPPKKVVLDGGRHLGYQRMETRIR
jgi:hypothetical protein